MPVAGGGRTCRKGGPDVDAIAMIFCFSATGNSRWVAGELARHLSDQVVDISDCLRRRSLPAGLAGAARVGVVFPIHGWHVPAPVGRFLRMLSAGLPGAAYRYAVCTCGDDVGKGLAGLRRSLGFGAVWTVAMPNTYVPMFALDSPEVASGKIAAARRRLAAVAGDVLACRPAWEVREGGFPRLKTYVLHPLFRLYVRLRPVREGGGCNGCGRCVRLCPVDNLRLSAGRPVFLGHCIHCMACVHGCPQAALSSGGSARRGQYRLEETLRLCPPAEGGNK